MEFTLGNSAFINPVPSEQPFVAGPNPFWTDNFGVQGGQCPATAALNMEAPYPFEIWGITNNGSYEISENLTTWNFDFANEPYANLVSMTTVLLPDDIMRVCVTNGPYNIPHSTSYYPRAGFLVMDCELNGTGSIVDYAFYPFADEEAIMPDFNNGQRYMKTLSFGAEFLAINSYPINESGDGTQIAIVGGRYDLSDVVFSVLAILDTPGSNINSVIAPIAWNGADKLLCTVNYDTTITGPSGMSLQMLTYIEGAFPAGDPPFATSGVLEPVTFDDEDITTLINTNLANGDLFSQTYGQGKVGFWLPPLGEVEPAPSDLIYYIVLDIVTSTYDKYAIPYSAYMEADAPGLGLTTLFAFVCDFVDGIQPYMIKEIA